MTTRRVASLLGVLLTLSTLLVAADADAHKTVEVPDSAFAQGAVHNGDARVSSRLVVDAEEVRRGDTFHVGVAFELDSDWHIYWQNPGDAGLPTHISWESDDLSFGPLQWAAPGLFQEADGTIDSYGYEGEVLLFSEVTVNDRASEEIEVAAFVDYLACSNACVEGHSQLSRQIPVGAQSTPADDAIVELFDDALGRVPQRAAELDLETAFHYAPHDAAEGDGLFQVLIEIVECQEAGDECRRPELVYDKLEHAVYADGYSDIDLETRGTASHPEVADGVLLKLDAWLGSDFESDQGVLSGVVEFTLADGTLLPVHLRDEFDVAPAQGLAVATGFPDWVESVDWEDFDAAGQSAPSPSSPNILFILLMALIGGMILNLMPCVFPVLALKITAITRLAHEDRRSVVTHGMAYVAGIVGSMMVLAAAVIGLRMAGTHVGWGFQFQQPYFLAALLVILVLFALNLFGVFEVTVGSQRLHKKAGEASGLRRSAWEGVLAVVLATPCSAPFLGTAVGFALTSNAITIIAVFAMLGLGLAAPMVVLTLVPGWAKVLPRPGNWMTHLKTFLGFALVATAMWILWIFGRQTGVDAMGLMLMFSGTIAVAAWLYGLVQFAPWSKLKIATLTAAIVVIGAGAYLAFPIDAQPRQAQQSANADGIDWQPWSEEAVDEALAQRRPVFVNFTADWCLTCQVNEENAIETDRVHQAVADYDVVMLKADWTDTDDDIREKLAEHNRAAIPYYLVYSPDEADDPQALSEIITANTLVDAFTTAAP